MTPNRNDGSKQPRRGVSRSKALRAQKQAVSDANRIASQYLDATTKAAAAERPRRANVIDDSARLKIIGLGGMDGGGSKNMIVIEYQNDAIVLDCGNDLGVDLPGINYGIADTSYLDQIKNKLKGFVITHGHLDHIGGLPHILPKYNVPVYGSRFTIGRVEEIFENFGIPMPDGFELKTVIMNETTHERLKIGVFYVELLRVTHAIPGSTMVIVDTPVGRIINTGDFRLDPNPLDHERTDVTRIEELAKEGVLLLMSESTTTETLGRTLSESEIEKSFIDIMNNAPGRIFVAIFSTNVNRVQMIVNAAVHHGKKIALDGRSMISTMEMAVRNGFLKIPKGTFIPMASVASMKDDQVVVVSTGAQGEPNSALVRMSMGDHQHVQMKEQDTVILSSRAIPYTGNDALIRVMVDDLFRKGVHVHRHETYEADKGGPLHVSGHGGQEEYREMIHMVKPKFFLPIYGDFTAKKYHVDMALEEGIPRANIVNVENGQVVMLAKDKIELGGEVPHGTILVDQTGAIVSTVVVKDRVLLAEEGMVAVVLTVDKKTGSLLTSPDIISRGFIYMKEQEELMNNFRSELRRAVGQRYKRVDLDRFKAELKDYVTHFLYERTQRSPIVIPVVNVIGGRPEKQGTITTSNGESVKQKTPEEIALEQQRRFAQMRQRLLNQDARVD
ncbi:MAG: Beta-lactamase domain protein [Candidatus Saccharibacteria bacterium GW2011_GWA2_46_10]|nr:MAG: Beta-lactamase domain protein [Candidatus Saccharibacteria bacterium GW2011_GWA2_46_10]